MDHVSASMFAGIGGFDLGLSGAGHTTGMWCESWEPARAVLEAHFPEVPILGDVRSIEALPEDVTLLTAGFPCQDLSQAGKTAGIQGERSGLVEEVFRLLRERERSAVPLPWLLIENVPFMLHLHRGKAMGTIVDALEALGYRWAYRVVNSRSFGVPQRRERVFLVASVDGDPRDVLFADDAGEPAAPPRDHWRAHACGFYWTEGNSGLGWATDAVPTLKGGSSVGIASPPAIVRRSGEIVTPDIRDAERLQGFPEGWTAPAEKVARPGQRWKLVGNAVTVGAARWIGGRLRDPGRYDGSEDPILAPDARWPRAAWGVEGVRHVSPASAWPLHDLRPLEEFLHHPGRPLSVRAARGFHERATRSTLHFPPGFLELVGAHYEKAGTR